jgi:hypothetical protein
MTCEPALQYHKDLICGFTHAAPCCVARKSLR